MRTEPCFFHQDRAAKKVVAQNGNGALEHKVGAGKTRSAIEIYKRLREKTPNLKMFVLCNKILIENAWRPDVKDWSNYSFKSLRKWEDTEKYEEDIFALNYEMIGSTTRNDLKLINFLQDYPVMAVLDESSKIKNPSAKITKKMLKIRKLFHNRIVMSGTMAANTELEYWSQFVFVDDVFITPFSTFQKEYFFFSNDRQSFQGATSRAEIAEARKHGATYKLSESSKKLIFEKMMPYWDKVDTREVIDLPDEMDMFRYVSLSAKQKAAYKQMDKENYIAVRNETHGEIHEVQASNALTARMKCRQITSGFVRDDNGVDVSLGTNEKMNAMLQFIEDEVGNEKQIIIWGNFRTELEEIHKNLSDVSLLLYGGVKKPDEIIAAFKQGEKQILIANPRSAAHGLTLTNASIEIFYSQNDSYELHVQQRGRIMRPGQKNNCLYVYFLVPETIDIDLYNVIAGKKSKQEVVNDWYKKMEVLHNEV